jgi:hypothetical protein
MNFKDKLTTIKSSSTANIYADKKRTRTTLKRLCATVSEELGLDNEKTARAMAAINKSPYGQIPALVLWLSGKYAWPVSETSQASEIPELQERMLDIINEAVQELNPNAEPIDGDALLDMKQAKGYNSFLDLETFTTVAGIEPDYDELEYLMYTFINNIGLQYCDFKMTASRYNTLETQALKDIKAEQEAAEAALARHNDMVGEA